MKKYFIFAVAALVAMCACTKNELASEIANQEISFQVANYAEGTKAGGAKLCGNENFKVNAYYKTTNDWEGTAENLYFSDVVKHQTDGAWKTDASYYWPKTGYLSFVAWSPASITNASKVEYTTAGGVVITGYAIPTTPGDDNKLDILTSTETGSRNLQYATSYTKPSAGTNPDYAYAHSGVPMLFKHILAKLNFNLEYDMTGLTDAQKLLFKVQVTKITLMALGKTATYTSGAWGTPSATSETLQLATTSNELTSTSATQTGYVTNYFIIPQAPVSLKVNYTINGIACENTIALSTSTLTAWEKNKVYTYNLKISPVDQTKPITFDPAVAAWESVNAGSIDVK